MSTTYEACLAIGAEVKSFKEEYFKEELLSSLDEDSYSDGDVDLSNGSVEEVLNRIGYYEPSFFGDYDNFWFAGFELANEEVLTVYDLERFVTLRDKIQEKLDALMKEKGLIKLEIRVVKRVY